MHAIVFFSDQPKWLQPVVMHGVAPGAKVSYGEYRIWDLEPPIYATGSFIQNFRHGYMYL